MAALDAGRARTSMNNERGIALLLVLWVIALLTVICAEFSWTMRTETVITRNFRDGEQAAYSAEAGINKAVVELMKNMARPQARSTLGRSGPGCSRTGRTGDGMGGRHRAHTLQLRRLLLRCFDRG